MGRTAVWVPGLWWLEVANALQMSVRRKRITPAVRTEYLNELRELPIRTDSETSTQAWGHTLALSDQHRLTVDDAAYLELALRRTLPLATLDRELRAAAVAEDIPLLGQ